MGNIRLQVRQDHLNKFPTEEKILTPFLNGFHVTWGRRRTAYNTSLSLYFLNPEEEIKEAYGFTSEVALIYAPYERMEARTLQAAEKILSDEPARGRVEKINYILVSDSNDVRNWLDNYILTQQESKIIISFSKKGLVDNSADQYYIKKVFDEQFYRRDLFNNNSFLPLRQDTYFFGRQQPLLSHFDSVRRSENRGVFGLRKTGKTSFLFKIERMIKNQRNGFFCFYDCKAYDVRTLRWYELLGSICDDVSGMTGIKISKKKEKYTEKKIGKTFATLIEKVNEKYIDKKVVLVFDEIEYISFKSKTNQHWVDDYIHFWGVIWATQSRNPNMVFIIAGVNPSVVEVDKIKGIPNPLFGIVTPYYLKGFSLEEIRVMIKSLGQRMGMSFTPTALEFLFKHYGGHPSLTRRACSLLNRKLEENNISKPLIIDQEYLKNELGLIDAEQLTFYCREVVSELEEFYEVEYEMLEFLASGQIKDFMDLSIYPESIAHLKSYGLLNYNESGTPFITIPVIKRHVALELARKEGRKGLYKVIDSSHRNKWIKQRLDLIIEDIRHLERLIQRSSLPSLFGPTSFPEADRFLNVKVVEDEDDFTSFINICSRCFVEPIEIYGKNQNPSKRHYFWNEIKTTYPSLFDALNRIKTYRNEKDHILLNDNANNSLIEYLDIDLEGESPRNVNHLFFTLQQRVLDGLLLGIQVETNRIS